MIPILCKHQKIPIKYAFGQNEQFSLSSQCYTEGKIGRHNPLQIILQGQSAHVGPSAVVHVRMMRICLWRKRGEAFISKKQGILYWITSSSKDMAVWIFTMYLFYITLSPLGMDMKTWVSMRMFTMCLSPFTT